MLLLTTQEELNFKCKLMALFMFVVLKMLNFESMKGTTFIFVGIIRGFFFYIKLTDSYMPPQFFHRQYTKNWIVIRNLLLNVQVSIQFLALSSGVSGGGRSLASFYLTRENLILSILPPLAALLLLRQDPFFIASLLLYCLLYERENTPAFKCLYFFFI